jgi:phenylacetate-CoA ligase
MNALSPVVRNVIFPLWVRKEHPAFLCYYGEFSRTQYVPKPGLEQLQLAKLRTLLAHAYTNCEFYRARMDAAGLKGGAIESLKDLQRLSALTKKDIQTHPNAMVARNIPESKRQRNQTGGSTGSPLQFWVDTERYASRMASTVRHNEWAGYRTGDWCAYLWGARMDMHADTSLWNTLRNHLLYRRLELNTSEVSQAQWERFIAEVQRVRPPVLLAYARSAVELGQEAAKRNIALRFRSIITTAEVLTDEHRAFLERSFGGKVYNRYGCREVSVIASECEHHTGLHVNADALLVEIEPDATLPNGYGRVLVTDLLNRSMPLIRYEIGDSSRWLENQQCPCGRGLPLLADIEGRTTEFLLMPDGRVISGPALTLIVADMSDVAQVQFVQTASDHIELRVVPGKGYGENTRQELKRRLALYLKGAAQLDVVDVESIAKEPSGKYRFVVSRIGEGRSVGSSH